jgi:hypothetical protein
MESGDLPNHILSRNERSIGLDSMTIRFSALEIAHIPFNHLQKDFTFHVGMGEYKYSSFLAFFFSPKLCPSHRIDRIFDEDQIEREYQQKMFEQFFPL